LPPAYSTLPDSLAKFVGRKGMRKKMGGKRKSGKWCDVGEGGFLEVFAAALIDALAYGNV